MEIPHLGPFVAAAEPGSFTRSAGAQGITQAEVTLAPDRLAALHPEDKQYQQHEHPRDNDLWPPAAHSTYPDPANHRTTMRALAAEWTPQGSTTVAALHCLVT